MHGDDVASAGVEVTTQIVSKAIVRHGCGFNPSLCILPGSARGQSAATVGKSTVPVALRCGEVALCDRQDGSESPCRWLCHGGIYMSEPIK